MKKLLWIVLLLCAGLALASVTSDDLKSTSNASAKSKPEVVQKGPESLPLMYPDPETLQKWIEDYENAPRAYISPFIIEGVRGAYSVLPHLCYVPAERMQGSCGNCWAWAGTGCMEVALDVQEATFDRLSVQYINSCQTSVLATPIPCCGAGNLEDFAEFYSKTQRAIPWSNTNAQWQDGVRKEGQPSKIPCDSIRLNPAYGITSIVAQSIPTQINDRARAIANIKNVIDQDKAIYFAFGLPDKASWDEFFNFWRYKYEGDVWDFNPYAYRTWSYNSPWHMVTCVGYNDLVATPYWEMVNSWGASCNRPNGVFRVKMDMDYNMYYNKVPTPPAPPTPTPQKMLYWQNLAVEFGPTPTPPPFNPSNWGMHRHDAQHTGRSEFLGSSNSELDWSYLTNGTVASSAAHGLDGTIYVGSNDNVLYAYSPAGQLLWSYVTGDGIYSSPALDSAENVYVGSMDARFYAFTSDGSLQWTYITGGALESSPAIATDGSVCIGSDDDNVYIFTSAGALSWSYLTGDDLQSSPAIAADGNTYVGSNDNRIYAFTSAGALAWSYLAGGDLRSSPSIDESGQVYIGCYDNNLYAFTSTGSLSWSYLAGGDIHSSPASNATQEVYVGSRDDNVYALTSGGVLSWSYLADGDVDSSPAIDTDGAVYVGTQGNILYAFNSNGTLLWSYAAGDAIESSPSIGNDGRIYIGSNGNRIDAIGKSITPTPTCPPTSTPTPTPTAPTPTPTITPTSTSPPTKTPTPTPTITPTPTNTPTGSSPPTATPTITPTPTLTPTMKPEGPWSMFHYDPRHTGTSRYYEGPPIPALLWSYRAAESVRSSPAVDSSGRVYIGSDDNALYVLSSNGAIVWSHVTAGDIDSSPAINAMQEVYVGSRDNRLYAFNSAGGLKWSYAHPSDGTKKEEDTWISSPVINTAGEIYMQARASLVAFSSIGTLAWSFSTDTPSVAHPSSPAIGTDGRIYCGTGNKDKLYAINSNSSLAWSYRTGSILRSSPAIGSDGKVIIGCYDNNLYAFTAGGALAWSCRTAYDVDASPAIDVAQKVYVGSRDNRFYAYTAAGALYWSYAVGAFNWSYAPKGNIDSSPAIGVTGIVHVGTHGNMLYAFNSNGTLLWSYEAGDWFNSSPALGAAQRVYVGSFDNNIYALAPPTNTPASTTTPTPTPTATTAGGGGCGLSWAYETGGDIYSSPAQASDGSVYVGSYDQILYAVSKLGELQWSYMTGDPIYSSPALDITENVYVGSEDNQLYSFNSAGGFRWSYRHPGGSPESQWESSSTIDATGLVYIQALNGLCVFDSAGALNWSFNTTAAGSAHPSSPAVGTDGRVFWCTGDVDVLYAVNSNCTLWWSYRTAGTVESSPSIGYTGNVYVGSYDNNLYAYTSAGALAWSYLTAGAVHSSPGVDGSERVYVGSRDNRLYVFTSVGSLAWSYEAAANIDSSPAIDFSGTVYVGAQDEMVYAFNSDGTLAWSFETWGSVNSSPALGLDGRLFVGSTDNVLRALGPAEMTYALHGTTAGKTNWVAVPFEDTGIDTTMDLGESIGAAYNFTADDIVAVSYWDGASTSTLTGTSLGDYEWDWSGISAAIPVGAMCKVVITVHSGGSDIDFDWTITGCAASVQFGLIDSGLDNWISLPWYKWYLTTTVEVGESIAAAYEPAEDDTLQIAVWDGTSEDQTTGTYLGEGLWDWGTAYAVWPGRPIIVRQNTDTPTIYWP